MKKKAEKINEIDIRIFGVPERIENIRQTQSILGVPDDRIIIDENHDGCIPTAKRAWEIEPSAEHILVLQDDILLCKDFLNHCKRMIKAHPDAILSLFTPNQVCFRKNIKRMPQNTPYIQTKELTAQGIVMPSKYIAPCLASWEDARRGDDTNILFWAKQNNILILTTIPTTIQHIGYDSVFDPGHLVLGSDFYDPDPSWVDWDTPHYTSWTNVTKR